MSIGNGGAGGMENNYYRTWQLQQHHNHKPYSEELRSPPPYGGDMLPHTEHIYESPKFDHKDYSQGINGDGYDEETGGAQYYELDSQSDTEGSNCPIPAPRPVGSARRVNNNGSICVDGRPKLSK